jgi:Domain of unknown function (DUF4304)
MPNHPRTTYETPADAQNAYRLLLSDLVSPRLKQLGFNHSRNQFLLPCEGCWVLIGFQKSKWSTVNRVQFTINLQVTKKEVWRLARSLSESASTGSPRLPSRPSPGTHYAMANSGGAVEPVVNMRIGHLLPESRRDYWWSVEGTTSLEQLAEDVLRTIDRFALPWLHQEMTKQECNGRDE